jgi:hypothetical protein
MAGYLLTMPEVTLFLRKNETKGRAGRFSPGVNRAQKLNDS